MTERPYSQFTEDELIMRDKLARSRTFLANERTMLAYVRTALAFVVTGLSFLPFFTSLSYRIIAIAFLTVGILLFIITPVRFVQIKKTIADQCLPCEANASMSTDEPDGERRNS